MIKRTLSTLLTTALLLGPSTSSLAKESSSEVLPNQIVYHPATGEAQTYPYTHINPEFSTELAEFVIANKCYGSLAGNVVTDDGLIPIVSVDKKTTGFKNKRIEAVTITAFSTYSLIAADQLFTLFSENNFEALDCSMLGDLFSIAAKTPIERNGQSTIVTLKQGLIQKQEK